MSDTLETIAGSYNHFLALTQDAGAAATLVLAHVSLREPVAEKPAGAPLTAAEAAKFMGVSVGTIYQLCASGRLRHQRVGKGGRGVIRVTEADLTQVTQDMTQEPDPRDLFAKHAAQRRKRAAG